MAVPRYFFHVIDGTSLRDKDGTELAGIHVARAEAIRLTGEILRDMGGRFWDGTEWRLEVADEQARVLFTLRFSAEEGLPERGAEPDPTLSPTLGPTGG